MTAALKEIWAFHDGPMVGYFVGRDPGAGANVAKCVRSDMCITPEVHATAIAEARQQALSDAAKIAAEWEETWERNGQDAPPEYAAARIFKDIQAAANGD